jgi:glycosyltransferase involved in cell wall biosynthesis
VNARPRLDYYTTTAPWPPTTGARLRVGAIHDALQRHGIDVRVIVVGERTGGEARQRIESAGGAVFASRSDATLPKVLRYVHGALSGRDPVVGQFFSAAGLERFGRRAAARRPDAVLLGNVFLAPLIPLLRRLLPGSPIILDNHNVESLLHRRMGAPGNTLRVRVPAGIVARTSQRLEDAYLARADQVWACSDVDAGYFRRAHGLPRVFTIPNAIDTDEFTVSLNREDDERAIVFTGTLWHPPNDQAAHRLIEICQRLWERGVSHTLYLVGQGPKAALLRRARQSPNVVVTGVVPDVKAYIARAHVVAAPLDVGSGTKLKLLQAMSMGKPVVTTAIGAEGLDLTDGVHAIVAQPSEFGEHLARLLESPPERARLGAAARAHVVEHFSLTALRRRMAEALREVLPDVALAG